MAQKKTEKVKSSIVISAIIALTLLVAWAMFLGINGILLSGTLAAIAGLAGWAIPFPKK